MLVSLFDIFKIGIGPSSSHTIGPMKIAFSFLNKNINKIENNYQVICHLYGSLALTGKGHSTDKAIILGLAGEEPDTIATEKIDQICSSVKINKHIVFNGKNIKFDPEVDIIFHFDEFLVEHSNGIKFEICNTTEQIIATDTYFSIGGGFIVHANEFNNTANNKQTQEAELPYNFETASELLKICKNNNLTIDQVVLANEQTVRSKQDILKGIDHIYNVMYECAQKGIKTNGLLPGSLGVKRRAPDIYKKIIENQLLITDPSNEIKYLSLYAIAINEENAAGGKVVTAPTNGSAGIIPAIAIYYKDKIDIYKYFLVATAIGILYKKRASFSAAEVGCQGEVGVASSMAAGALTACLGGTLEQIENAAEIAMEHSLGLTCDPVGGLVQIPCIERNSIGAVKTITASQLALISDGIHKISLDQVIKTMLQTGKDMQSKYKETSQGGLAVNFPEC